MELPKTITQKVYFILDPWGKISVRGTSMSSLDDFTCIGSVEMTFSVPQVDVTALQIASLEKTREKVVAECAYKLETVDRKIQELRALPNLSEG